MKKSKTTKQRPTIEQLRVELVSLRAAIKRTLEDLKAELAGLRTDLRGRYDRD